MLGWRGCNCQKLWRAVTVHVRCCKFEIDTCLITIHSTVGGLEFELSAGVAQLAQPWIPSQELGHGAVCQGPSCIKDGVLYPLALTH